MPFAMLNRYFTAVPLWIVSHLIGRPDYLASGFTSSQCTYSNLKANLRRQLVRPFRSTFLLVTTFHCLYLMSPHSMPFRSILIYSILSALHIQPVISFVPASSHVFSRAENIVQFSALNTRQDGNDTLVQITSPDFVNIAFGSENGNLYFEQEAIENSSSGVDTTTLFRADSDGNIYSDFNDRMFHIYSEEAASFGVSRLRLHDVSDLPNTSVLV